MEVSLKTEKRRSHFPVFSFRQRLRRAEGLQGMTTEDLHGNVRRSAPPALLPLISIVIPDHSSFSVLRETPMTFACGHFKKLKCDPESKMAHSKGFRLRVGASPENPSMLCVGE